MKIKVGDIIIANPKNNWNAYGVTCAKYGFVGRVTESYDRGWIEVKTLYSDRLNEIGFSYTVESKYFLIKENEETIKLKEFLKSLAER